MIVLSKSEREFITKLNRKDGEEAVRKSYSIHYLRQLKHRILKKRVALTDDLLLVNQVLNKLEKL